MKRLAKKVLLIGWDAADWKVINPLLDSGKMPALEKLVNTGVIGNIATLDPPLSPMLWTSIATGKKANKHGILGFVEPDPISGSIRPVNVTSRKCRTLWNILNYHGLKSNVVGWWPSHPAEPINGVMVSNFFSKCSVSYGKRWPISDGSVYPAAMTWTLKNLRIHPQELTSAHILPFVPLAAQIDQEKDHRLAILAKITAEAASIHAVATYLMENTEWDFMAVYYDSIDHYGHAFMKYHPPKMSNVSEEDFELYKNVVEGGYIFHDMMLDRLIQLAGDDTAIVIVSDHGFYSDHLRPENLPRIPAAPAIEHRPYGILCMKHDTLKKDERIYGASLLDITPTILTLFGIEPAKDMDGKVLTGIFQDNIATNYIESWENIEGDFGTHPAHLQEDTLNSAAALKQLVDLGYIEDPGEDNTKALNMAIKELKYNLSRVYFSSGNVGQTILLLEELQLMDNNDLRFPLDLAKCYLQKADYKKVKHIIQFLKSRDGVNLSYLEILEGIALSGQNKIHAALRLFKKANECLPEIPALHIELGKAYLSLERFQEALNVFNTALEKDDENAFAWHGLSIAHLRLGNFEDAAESALNAVGLLYHFPYAHYHLGEALYNMGRFKEAMQAFELVLNMNSKLVKAAVWLLKLHEKAGINNSKTIYYKELVKDYMKGNITIVSGLPRSGTSMMMQILQAGGMKLLTDAVRKADDNNPRGYFEYEMVKNLTKDQSWLNKADGKVVKIIAQLLRFLPSDFNYKVIFMRRDMYEIIVSQQKMLGRSIDKYPLSIASAYEKELEKVEIWHQKEPNVDLIYIDYKELLFSQQKSLTALNEFLGHTINIEEAVKVIDRNLYRTKLI